MVGPDDYKVGSIETLYNVGFKPELHVCPAGPVVDRELPQYT